MTQKTINLGTADQGNGDPLRVAFGKVNDNFTELYTALGLNVGGLNLGAFEFAGSVISTTDSSAIVIDQAVTVSSNLTVGGDVLPSVANGGDLGSSTLPWRSLYVSNNTIYIGGTAVGVDANGALTTGGTVVGSTPAWANITGKPTIPTGFDRLTSSGDEVILIGGADPFTLFPAITGGDQLQIQGAEVTSVSGSLALTSQDNLNIIANGSGAAPGGSKNWTFGDDGSLQIPGDIRSEGNINIEINLTDSTLRRWQFGEDGLLTFPDGTNQSTAYTGFADLKGSVFADDSTLMVDAVDNKIYATELTVAVGNFVDVNSNNVGVENINGLASQINFTVGGNNNLVIENNLVTIQNVSLSVAGDITLGGNIRSEGNINIDINLSDSTLRRWQFGEDGNLETPGGIQVAGILKIDNGVHEKFQTKADSVGIVTHDCSLGHIFYHTSPDGLFTVNFTNLNLPIDYATSLTLIIAQGGTGFIPGDQVAISGVLQTINWQGNVTPTPSTNRTDVVRFSIINVSGTYTVLGQLTGF